MLNYLLFAFSYKNFLKRAFSFLTQNGFALTEDPRLIIKPWKRRGIGYTNGELVIVIGDDEIEKRFLIIIYKIQPNFKFDIYDKSSYTTFDCILEINNIVSDRSKLISYKNRYELFHKVMSNAKELSCHIRLIEQYFR